jgi:hypothetical protein
MVVKRILLILAVTVRISGADSLSRESDEWQLLREPDSSGHYISVPGQKREFEKVFRPLVRCNPVIAGGLSAAVPGAGQIYIAYRDTHSSIRIAQWVRGGLFFAAQGIAAGVLINRAVYYRLMDGVLSDSSYARETFRQAAASVTDSARAASYMSSYRISSLNYELARYERRFSRYNLYNAIGWNAGLYIFNVANAVGKSNFFYNEEPRSPAVAGGLSAIPMLALGQLYNGAVAKAGMIWMTQTMLLHMAYRYQQLMDFCIEQQKVLADSSAWQYDYRSLQPYDFEQRWEGNYSDVFRRRNLYLWYAVFFYFYSIFDAVVDAHLHDYGKKIRMQPSYDPGTGGIGAGVSLFF